jgi:hypothetical protein
MTRSRSILAGLLFPALVISAAHAQATIDVSKITCDQFRNQALKPASLALWLVGFYAGKHNDTTIDFAALDRKADKVIEYCQSNPRVTVMDAIEATIVAQPTR